jgi:hypothetical protein
MLLSGIQTKLPLDPDKNFRGDNPKINSQKCFLMPGQFAAGRFIPLSNSTPRLPAYTNVAATMGAADCQGRALDGFC